MNRTSVLIFLLGLFPAAATAQHAYEVHGTVRDLYTNAPLVSVNVTITELSTGAITDTGGHYKIGISRKGIYTVLFSRVGYKRNSRKVNFEKNASIALNVKLEETSIVFEAQEITPGVIEISTDEGSSSTVTNQEIVSSPGVFTKDVYRTLQVVPGVANSEWSSKPHIKGGNPDETAVVIDNLEIYEPFHLEEIDGPYSVISSDLVKDMKLITGGFSPKYSDKMSGILKISTIDRIDEDSVKASLDFTNAGASLNQRINDRTNVFFSGRRSFIYLLEKASDQNFPTTVYDIWSKIDYKADANNRWSVNFLFLDDDIRYRKDSTFIRKEFFTSTKRNYYLWLNWYRTLHTNRFFSTTAGFQSINKTSDFAFDGSLSSDNADRRSVRIFTLKHDHSWKIFPEHTFEFGAEYNQFFADYRYHEYRLNPTETTEYAVSTDIIDVDTKLDGYTAAAYVQDTYAWTDRFQIMGGWRVSAQDYTRDIQFSPRTAASYSFSDDLNLKVAWGLYYQPDNFYKMKTYADQSVLDREAEKSMHYIASLSYLHQSRTMITVDAFYKDYLRLNDDFAFDFSNRIEGIGIVDKPFHTRSGHAVGIDVFVKHRYGHNNLFSVAYSGGASIIKNENGIRTYRNLDRTHSVTVSNIHNITPSLSLSALFRIHTGDPYTPSEIRILGDSLVSDSRVYYLTKLKNSGRLPLFHGLDLRIEKRWNLNQLYLVTYAGVINVYDHDNVRQRSWKRHVADGKVTGFTREDQLYFPRFYNVGLSLEFSIPRSR